MRTTTRVPDPPTQPFKVKYNTEDVVKNVEEINSYLSDLHRFLGAELDRGEAAATGDFLTSASAAAVFLVSAITTAQVCAIVDSGGGGGGMSLAQTLSLVSMGV